MPGNTHTYIQEGPEMLDERAIRTEPKGPRLKPIGGELETLACDPTERLVAQIWRRTLGKRFPNRHARSIMEMRIGSRPVYRFLADIEKATGVALPFACVFQAPTVPELAEVIRTGRVPPFEPLILFRKSCGGPPLFLLPGIGGSVFQLFELASLVVHNGPVYLNQQAGLDGTMRPHSTVADMVAFQVAAIKKVHPRGPYLLLGYSLGGLIALEVARRLIAVGDDVAFVGMIEPGLPEPVWPRRVRLDFLVGRALHHLTKLKSLSAREAAFYLRQRVGPLLGRLGRMFGTQALGKSAYQLEELHPWQTSLVHASSEAYHNYRPSRFERQIVLFCSAQGDPLDCDPLRIWPTYLTDFAVRYAPGDHKTVLRGESVQVLAREVSALLSKTAGRNG